MEEYDEDDEEESGEEDEDADGSDADDGVAAGEAGDAIPAVTKKDEDESVFSSVCRHRADDFRLADLLSKVHVQPS
jgi:hypothetical protein